MLKKIKTALASKEARMATIMTMALSLMVVASSAVEGDTSTGIDTATITQAFTTGFQSIVTNSISMLSAMLPIALSLCAVLFLVKKGMSWFRSIAK